MGIRTNITIEQINKLIKDMGIIIDKIEPTKDGISDSTYIIFDKNKKYIFKIYEFASEKEIINEIEILNSLKTLPVPKVITNINKIKLYNNKPTALFSFLDGYSLTTNITLEQVKEIGSFLGKFHSLSKNIISINKNIYSQENLKTYLNNIKKSNIDKNILKNFEDKYNIVKNLDLKSNGVIHGDLFPDNAKFINNKLSGVFDFIEACNGNFAFDLSVLINSWCFNDDYTLNNKFFINIVKAYNKTTSMIIEKNSIKEYMRYSCLFYACQRYNTKYIEKRDVEVKDYNEYLIKFENI